MITILEKVLKLIKNSLIIFLIFPLIVWSVEKFSMENPAKEKITLRLAITSSEHQRGLSGLKPNEFRTNEGMLFINDRVSSRRFWMPDTYFNLDIIFLDDSLRIVGIENNVPAHPGFSEPPAIYRTKEYQAKYILETKAGVKFSKKLKSGDKLTWISASSLSEIELKTRQKQ